jgi:pimeloyl-ACP methyl ester carboxylesterase
MASLSQKLYLLTAGFGFMVVGVFGAFLGILLTFLRHPFTAFKKKNRERAPEILLDPSYGTHQYVRANGIRFHYVAGGDRNKPLMLFLHGFPEFWFSWRYQLKEFQKDYYTVAVDMRGYGESDHPLDKKGYSIGNLVKDIVELISALGYSKCTLVAHDWGGVIAWRVVYRHPELIERFIPMNCPHPKVFQQVILESFSQMRKMWYIFFFQVPVLPELLIGLRDFRALGSMFLGKAGLKNNRADVTEEVMEAYKFMFGQPNGLTCPINYYRNMLSSSGMRSKEEGEKIEVPVLLIWGNDDVVLGPSLADADRYSKYCADLTVK